MKETWTEIRKELKALETAVLLHEIMPNDLRGFLCRKIEKKFPKDSREYKTIASALEDELYLLIAKRDRGF